MEDCPWLCSSLFRSSRGYTAERGCSQTLQILTARPGSSHALVGMGEALPAPAMTQTPHEPRKEPHGFTSGHLWCSAGNCTHILPPKASCPPEAMGMALSAVRAGRQARLSVPGSSGPDGRPCKGGKKRAPLWKNTFHPRKNWCTNSWLSTASQRRHV